ncbi:protein of unknown function [Blastococcus saxobsidens DD2]|uniref:Uncharacterized protein n=1 Tax=Blastococcus saxobsidens (strain DD2) TaxID=1146883 RepID=H6RQP5_BLASD|nr:protein of unknown function [Blastococcus saxobsidens DD2]
MVSKRSRIAVSLAPARRHHCRSKPSISCSRRDRPTVLTCADISPDPSARGGETAGAGSLFMGRPSPGVLGSRVSPALEHDRSAAHRRFRPRAAAGPRRRVRG